MNHARDVQEDAFLGGILHDVGKLLFAVNCPELYDEILELVAAKKMSLPVVEREVFGASHAQLGAYVLGLWGMADPVVEAIAFQKVISTELDLDRISKEIHYRRKGGFKICHKLPWSMCVSIR